jgi:predicted nucleotidyltransferase
VTALTRAQAIVSQLREAFGQRLQSAALFGSRARGDARPDSDLDLLIVLAERNATDYADAARTLDDAGFWR